MPEPAPMMLDALPGVEDDRADIGAGDRVMLVVEDDPAFARILYGLAQELGFRCVCVGGRMTRCVRRAISCRRRS